MFKTRTVKFLGGLQVDLDRTINLSLQSDGSYRFDFYRKLIKADTFGVPLKDIKRGKITSGVRRGSKAQNTFLLSPDGANTLKRLLNIYLK